MATKFRGKGEDRHIATTGAIIGIVATVVTIVSGANTLFTGYLQGAAQRRQTFREAVKNEQGYWGNLYHEYLLALDTKTEPDGSQEVLNRKLLAICQLASRDVPPFDDYPLGYQIGGQQLFDTPGDDRLNARAALLDMRDKLRQAISAPSSSTEIAAQCIGQRDAEEADQSASRDREAPASIPQDSSGAVPVPPPPTLSAALTTQANVKATADTNGNITSVLSAGSPTGWDVDVFWCDGDNKAPNQASAQTIAKVLADWANAQKDIGAGIHLGRIRLRPLPVERQTDQQPHDRNYVAYDSGPGEQDVAQALLRTVGSRVTPALTPFPSRGRATKWYLSIFVCAATG